MDYFKDFDLKSIENMDLFAKQVVEGFIIGLHKSPFHGFSVEFAEHRIYNQGDTTKNIDWKDRQISSYGILLNTVLDNVISKSRRSIPGIRK